MELDEVNEYHSSTYGPCSQCVISCLIGTFGGTTIAMLSLGQPPGWAGNLGSPVAFAMGFWMIFLCPGDIFYKLITRHRSVELVREQSSPRTLASSHRCAKGSSSPLPPSPLSSSPLSPLSLTRHWPSAK